MILQGINEIFGGIKDKKQGKKDLARIEKERGSVTPRISSIAQEDLINPYDKSFVNMMRDSQGQRFANQYAAAGRNPLASARVSSTNTQEGLQSDMALLNYMTQQKSGARERYRKEEVGVMDKKWEDFLGRRGEAKNLIQQGKQRSSSGLGSIDSAITSVATMGMSNIGSAVADVMAPTPPPQPGNFNMTNPNDPTIDPTTGEPI